MRCHVGSRGRRGEGRYLKGSLTDWIIGAETKAQAVDLI